MAYERTRVLVSGARGFLGSHVVTQARNLGVDAFAGYRGASGAGAVALDICDGGSIDQALRFAVPDVVIHCAAYGLNYAQQDLDEALAVNVHGSLRMLAAAKRFGARRFVHIGTCFEYGSYSTPIAECFALNPTALYGATKAAAAVLMKERAIALGMQLIVARPFSLWGPNDAPHHLVPQVVAACTNRQPLNLTSCDVIRDYMYIEDMAHSIVAIALLPDDLPNAETINLGSGQGLLLRDFILAIARQLDGEQLMQFGGLPYRSTEMKSLVADVTKMRRLLGNTPRTSFRDGVLRMGTVAARP